MAGDGLMMLRIGASRYRYYDGTGTDVAIESAKITLVKGDLQRLSRLRIESCCNEKY
jgi:hypothetical protein